MKLVATFACILQLVQPGFSAPTSTPSPAQNTTPASTGHQSGGEEHIVIINKNAPITPRVAEVLNRLDLHENHPDVRHVFNNSAFQGFAASMKSHCLDLLANMSDISTVERAVTVSRASATLDTRPGAPWGLQRISTSASFTGNAQDLDYTYSYEDSTLGAGADVYIIDTGIYTQHQIFGGRAQMLWTFDNDWNDNDGHGTHVAGTAAGSILGVASNANILGIKVLDADGAGWSSNVVAGIDVVIQRHDARQASADPAFAGSVMSMSLATASPVDAITQALAAAAAAGVHACVAAGNAATDACQSSPAAAGGAHGPAIAVGALDIATARAAFSNAGACVDLYAPGVDVVSAWPGAPNMVNLLSGTSMAAPHVTGIVACAAAANATLARSPALMKEWVRAAALRTTAGLALANNGVVEAGQISSRRRRRRGRAERGADAATAAAATDWLMCEGRCGAREW